MELIKAKMMLWRDGADAVDLAAFLNQYRDVKRLDYQMAADCYQLWLPTQPELVKLVPSLKGKTLGCWCLPRPCHCIVLRDSVEG